MIHDPIPNTYYSSDLVSSSDPISSSGSPFQLEFKLQESGGSWGLGKVKILTLNRKTYKSWGSWGIGIAQILTLLSLGNTESVRICWVVYMNFCLKIFLKNMRQYEPKELKQKSIIRMKIQIKIPIPMYTLSKILMNSLINYELENELDLLVLLIPSRAL